MAPPSDGHERHGDHTPHTWPRRPWAGSGQPGAQGLRWTVSFPRTRLAHPSASGPTQHCFEEPRGLMRNRLTHGA
ncbi:hypothetical protein F751_1760 [Auxenochlorella protothecoides]|uniref:Uncharacterized protein n=1 Tax=Auxenochlorella protothecoides TaxID=3075 RepID=A0A087SGM7_AUXPR|nr:hypothetical protein F751_1760 [Auxenochlorella protothecoides]KFM24881.1 hypothetical protein F751_1760 [Auxenochlorella protothecoides]